MKIICGTGHRPNKLGGYSQEAYDKLLTIATIALTDTKPDKVISGMALGWDQALAEAAINLQIPVIAAVPFKGQEGVWTQSSKTKYKNIINKCSKIVVVCEGGYSAASMQIRNEWMVNNCNVVVALWDGTNGGTGNCIRYAKTKPVTILNYWNDFKSL